MVYGKLNSIVLTALLTTAPAAWAAAVAPPADDDWLPDAASVDARPQNVPAVPLPPAFYGSAASLGLIVALRYSRHRRWLTLR